MASEEEHVVREAEPEEPVMAIGSMTVLEDLLHQLDDIVRSAKSMPLSASVIVNKRDVLDIVETLKRSLPEELARARSILHDADAVLDRAREEGQKVLERAKAERQQLVSKTEIVQTADREAVIVRADADAYARRIRSDAERYVESKLANFEVMLQKTLQVVERGRARLEGREEADRLTNGDDPEAQA